MIHLSDSDLIWALLRVRDARREAEFAISHARESDGLHHYAVQRIIEYGRAIGYFYRLGGQP